MARLDVAEAADLLRDGSEANRDGMVLGRQLLDDLTEQRLVIGDQLALGAALLRIAENVERGAAQEFESREHAERRQHPRTELHLARQPRHAVLAREQR